MLSNLAFIPQLFQIFFVPKSVHRAPKTFVSVSGNLIITNELSSGSRSQIVLSDSVNPVCQVHTHKKTSADPAMISSGASPKNFLTRDPEISIDPSAQLVG